jgi:hypothetical protein
MSFVSIPTNKVYPPYGRNGEVKRTQAFLRIAVMGPCCYSLPELDLIQSASNFFVFYASNKWIHSYHDKDTSMKINESNWDSVLRIFSGLFLLYVGLAGELTGASAVLAGLFGLFLLLTGVSGFCPVYTLFRRKK